ncbi:MAG: hypothetical protein U0414_02705 [Polyangiaceae bacterium]
MKTPYALLALLSLAGCSSTPTKPVAPNPSASAVARATTGAPADTAVPPPVGAKEGAPALVHQLVLGRDAWSVYSSDGKLAVTLVPGSLTLVDVDTGRVRGSTPIDCVGDAVFTSDNRFVLFTECAGNGWVREWDLARNEIEGTTVSIAEDRLVAEPAGRHALVFSPKAATIVDSWSHVATDLDVPVGADITSARFASDGAVVLFRKHDVLHYAPSRTAPTVTSVGEGALQIVAAAVDARTSRAAVLLTSGDGMILDPASGKRVAKAPVCGEKTPRSIHFLPDSDGVVAHCGAAVTRFDGALQSAKQYFYDDSALFEVAVAGQKLFVQRDKALVVYDVSAGTWSAPIAIADAVVLAGGARAGRRNGSHVVAIPSGAPIWEPAAGLPGIIRDVRDKAALFTSNEAIDLRSGETFDFSSVSLDGGVVLRTVASPDGKGGLGMLGTVEDRGSGKTWSVPLGPDASAELSASGRYVIEVSTDYSTNPDGVTAIVVHGPSLTRRLTGLNAPTTTLNDLLVLQQFVSAPKMLDFTGPRPMDIDQTLALRFYNIATGTDTISKLANTPENLAADGTRLVAATEVFDTSTQRVVWRLPEGEIADWFAQDSDVVVARPMTGMGAFRVLSAKDGKELFTTTEGGVVTTASRDALLLVTDSVPIIVRPGVPPIQLSGAVGQGVLRMSKDGAIVWYQRPDHMLAAHRVADGRELLFSLGGAPITDEGVFDPKDAARVRLLVRSGPNLLESPLSSVVDSASRYAHPNLVTDFLAGAPVSPR